MPKSKFTIVSDGACSKNPGPGGWGTIVAYPDETVKEFGGSDSETTNNRMELLGFYRGLDEVYDVRKKFPEIRVLRAISDSKYVLDGASSFLARWEKNGWKTVAGGEVKNHDLWEKVSKIQKLLEEADFRIEYELVKGHSGHEGNERCDQIAVRFTHEEPIELYSGPLSNYSVSLFSAPAGKPFSACYLSYIDGILNRYHTWDECRRAVEGKSGAKYKKVKTAVEERETLALWEVKE
jgi:ribonuclease HI